MSYFGKYWPYILESKEVEKDKFKFPKAQFQKSYLRFVEGRIAQKKMKNHSSVPEIEASWKA